MRQLQLVCTPSLGLGWPWPAFEAKAVATAQPTFQRGSHNHPCTGQGTRPAGVAARFADGSSQPWLTSMLQYCINIAEVSGFADGAAVLTLCNEGMSLSRGRRGGRGQSSDLREGGAVEKPANIVDGQWKTHRPDAPVGRIKAGSSHFRQTTLRCDQRHTQLNPLTN
jgi:hypothetical protein